MDERSKPQLQDLLPECLAALAHPRRASNLSPCLEILQQAVEQCDQAALRVLLTEISYPLVARYCPPELLHCLSDIQQEVALRLLHRFSDSARPLVFTSFPAYLKYLAMTVRSVATKMLKREQMADQWEDFVLDDPTEAIAAAIERTQLAYRVLALLPDPLQRECLRRRYLLDQSPDEIAQALQPLYPGLTKAQVYRAVERGLRWLRENADLCGCSGPD
ncbi:MAG: sigma-70 family RNA polymerase sigma factor [Anaerolineae bacterium]|nr:sigma-70 family RNA polymerase sigma factor [Anaerolineae bacterium]